MLGKRHNDAEKIKALEQQLHTQKRAWRQKRWQRLKAGGRVVELPAHPPPITQSVTPGTDQVIQTPIDEQPTPNPRIPIWRLMANKGLLFVEIMAVIVQDMYDWEQLKRGVAPKIDAAAPGKAGNMALAAHNDIYGEIFRDLD